MSMHPYLFLTNTAREAMTAYQEIPGGELRDVAGTGGQPVVRVRYQWCGSIRSSTAAGPQVTPA